MVEIGDKINGRYRVIRSIGSGGMANVFLAYDLILDREVAVKVLRFDFLDDASAIRRFRREALAASELVHPNIVGVYDVGQEDERQYLVMEYVKGSDLKKYIKAYHPIPIENVIIIMRQILSAISLAHEHRIIHRDLKPQNILMDEHGNVKIADFGIAIALSETSLTQTNTLLGSVHYLSPEQARGSMATRQSDIYALGIILYELLTGKVPFEGESAVSIALKHFQADIPSVKEQNPEIPQALENVILKATTKEPSDRYVSAEEMSNDLATCLSIERANEARFEPKEVAAEATKRLEPITEITGEMPEAFKNMKQADLAETTAEKAPAKKQVEEEKPKKRKKRWLWLLPLVLLIAAGTFFATIGTGVEVPDVSGRSVDSATELLQAKGFKVASEIKEKRSDDVEKGQVIETNPKQGRKISKKEAVTLVVSKGPSTIEVEDYSGKKFETVKKELIKLGFEESTIQKEEVEDDEVEVGIIVDQDPSAGSKVKVDDDTITLTVSKGTKQVTLSDLTGYTLTEAINYFNGVNLSFIQANSEFSDVIPENAIIRTDPGAGAELSEGSTVVVVVSKGPQPYEPPTSSSEKPEDSSSEELPSSSSSSEESQTSSSEQETKPESQPETGQDKEVQKDDEVGMIPPSESDNRVKIFLDKNQI